jgi:lipopolysaccharide transport system ATP-binding protein
LHNVSFEVSQGEVLGIIGRNGAGKSTLLKILSRITKPTTGRIEGYGRVGSLLEVGTGFHPELTGRENILLNGAILGMKRVEIERNLDSIVAFSGIERFMDTPVKRYSSGMYVRLAFAVAAHLEPEILVVDEVLAVGDAAFQKKCLGKMEDFSHEGRTVLFVSHNLTALEGLCPRSIWLEQGQIVGDGATPQILADYLQATPAMQVEQQWTEWESAPGNDQVRLQRARVRPQQGNPQDVLTVHTPLTLEFDYWNAQSEAHLDLSMQLFNQQGILVCDVGRESRPPWLPGQIPRGTMRDLCHIPGDLLNDGLYRLDLYIREGDQVVYYHQNLLVFEIQDSSERRENWYGQWPGVIRPRFDWHTEWMGDSLVAE